MFVDVRSPTHSDIGGESHEGQACSIRCLQRFRSAVRVARVPDATHEAGREAPMTAALTILSGLVVVCVVYLLIDLAGR